MYTVEHLLAVRDAPATSNGPTPLTVGLLAALLCLALISLVAIGALYWIRRRRMAQKAKGILPSYEDDMLSVSSKSNHRRNRSSITINFNGNSNPTFTVSEKQEFVDSANGKAGSNPLPEIRITFPEEVDGEGKRQSGRVVVVHLNEHGVVGLEPTDENLPAYQLQSSGRFQSLDLERIGGLKEKERMPPH